MNRNNKEENRRTRAEYIATVGRAIKTLQDGATTAKKSTA